MFKEFPFDVFLSHNHKDKPIVRRLAERLRGEGLRVWYDDWNVQPGEIISQRVSEGVEQSRVLLLCLSPTALASDWIILERYSAIHRDPANVGRRFIPVMVAECELPESLHLYKHVEFWEDTDAAFNSVLKAIRIRESWENYEGLLELTGYKVAYLPLLAGNHRSLDLAIGDVEVIQDREGYSLPVEFRATELETEFADNPCCRLENYDFLPPRKLRLTLSETSYGDYLKSGEHLDDPVPGRSNRTFRAEFANLVKGGRHNLRELRLTNISGVGALILTGDNRVIVSRHSDKSHVYPGRWTFAFSGVMKWGASPDPFWEVLHKGMDEASHQVKLNALRLVGFGADARKLYFQFSFVEKTLEPAKHILHRCRGANHQLDSIPLELEEVMRQIVDRCWEPAAEAALLSLVEEKFGRDAIVGELNRVRDKLRRKETLDEWDYRAGQLGLLPVLSIRYPHERRNQISQDYVAAVMQFMDEDISGKRVLDVGCGIGRMIVKFLAKGAHVTAVDLCEQMVQKAKKRVLKSGEALNRVAFEVGLIQDHVSREKYDVAICSLVLVHITGDAEFAEAVAKLCQLSLSIFIFEDITSNRPTSPHTVIRSKEALLREFARHGFSAHCETTFQLDCDTIVFLKLVPNSPLSAK